MAVDTPEPAHNTRTSLLKDLTELGVKKGDGLFVHASMKAVGFTIGGARTIVEALLDAVGKAGLLGMPGFSTDAYFPSTLDRSTLTQDQITQIEDAVPGFDVGKSPTDNVGLIGETFRTWPGTRRSDHPSLSVCLNGPLAQSYLDDHSLAWATGAQSPFGRLQDRPDMKILLIGVGWNRCTALHTAETFAAHRRTKMRRMKIGGADGGWIEAPDVADELNRLFPSAGEAFEQADAVTTGTFGAADCRLCGFRELIGFGAGWIDQANAKSGDRA